MQFSLAIRNIRRNKRRSILTVTAMVTACSLLMLGMGISDGKMHDMLSSATKQYHGDLVISQTGYQALHSMFIHFPPDAALLEKVARAPGVTGVSPRLRGFGLLSFDQAAMPVEVLGVMPDKESRVTTLQDKLVAGNGFGHHATPGNNEVLLGRGLAEKLKVGPGDRLVLVGTGSDGSIANDLLTVSGIFSTGNRRNDTALILVRLSFLQTFLVLPDRVHELAVSMETPMQARTLAKALLPVLPAALEARDWGQFLPEIRDAIAISHVSNMIVLAIFYLATGLCVFNTVYMSVIERSREFGILLALGTRPGQIRKMIFTETFVMGSVSVFCGTLLGFAMNLYMANIGIDLSGSVPPITYAGGTILPVVHSVIHPVPQILSALAMLPVSVLAGYVPANKAVGFKPVEMIQGGHGG